MAYAIRTRPKSGAAYNGDGAVVVTTPGGALVFVVDALGVGEQAAQAAQTALLAAERLATREVDEVLAGVHAALRGTSGAAAVALRIAGADVRAAGVGNVSVRGAPLTLSTSPGILGFQHAPLEVVRGVARAGSRIAVFTDGVAPGLDPAAHRDLDVDAAAEELFRRHAVTFDDAALVLLQL